MLLCSTLIRLGLLVRTIFRGVLIVALRIVIMGLQLYLDLVM